MRPLAPILLRHQCPAVSPRPVLSAAPALPPEYCLAHCDTRGFSPSHTDTLLTRPRPHRYLPVETADLGGESKGVRAAEAEAADAEIKGYKKSIYQLALDDSKRGEIGIVPIKSGKLPRELLRSEDVYVVDSGFQLYLWVGCAAEFPLRISAFVFAQAYLKRFQRPSILPLTRFAEGQESEAFWWLFEKPIGYRIDSDPSKDPERFHPMMRKAPKAKKVAKPEYAPVQLKTGTPDQEPKAAPATQPKGTPQPALGTAPAATPPLEVAKLPVGGNEPTDEAADSDEEEEEGPPPPDWRLVPWKDKLRCYDGTCFPVVSDAWGCCLTSIGCSWSDRVACCGMDFKGGCLSVQTPMRPIAAPAPPSF